jgi:hypothetical protein
LKLLFQASAKVDTQDLDYIVPLQYLFGKMVGGVYTPVLSIATA